VAIIIDSQWRLTKCVLSREEGRSRSGKNRTSLIIPVV
jgi:hypothetical protein